MRTSTKMLLGLIPGTSLAGVGGASLDPDAAALIAAMAVPPDGARQALISDTIGALKAAGIWSLLDELWMLAAHSAQAGLLGWKRYKDCTAVNAPTWTQDRGYAGNGTTSYLDTGYVPSTDGVQYKLNDASFGVYSRTNTDSSSVDIGARDGSGLRRSFFQTRTGGAFAANLNQDALSYGPVVANSSGLRVVRRTASNALQAMVNGVSLGISGSHASSGLTARPLYIGALNDVGTPMFFSSRQYAMAFVGASLSDQQQADLYTINQAYMTALGAAV